MATTVPPAVAISVDTASLSEYDGGRVRKAQLAYADAGPRLQAVLAARLRMHAHASRANRIGQGAARGTLSQEEARLMHMDVACALIAGQGEIGDCDLDCLSLAPFFVRKPLGTQQVTSAVALAALEEWLQGLARGTT